MIRQFVVLKKHTQKIYLKTVYQRKLYLCPILYLPGWAGILEVSCGQADLAGRADQHDALQDDIGCAENSPVQTNEGKHRTELLGWSLLTPLKSESSMKIIEKGLLWFLLTPYFLFLSCGVDESMAPCNDNEAYQKAIPSINSSEYTKILKINATSNIEHSRSYHFFSMQMP